MHLLNTRLQVAQRLVIVNISKFNVCAVSTQEIEEMGKCNY